MPSENEQWVKKQKHLEMIGRVVDRLSTNSFLLKGWSVVLVSALLALSAKDVHAGFAYLSFLPAFAFWGLDGYFLWQERLFRRLYEHVRSKPDNAIDFSMDTKLICGEVPTWPEACFSRTLWPFHGVVVGTIVVVMCITY